MKLKKLLIIILAALMVFMLSACTTAQEEATDAPTEAPSDNNQAENNQNQDGAAVADNTEIGTVRQVASEKLVVYAEPYTHSLGTGLQGYDRRPAGYHEKIGIALAYKMSFNVNDPDKIYETIVSVRTNVTENILDKLSEHININEWQLVGSINTLYDGTPVYYYYARLTAAQINELVNLDGKSIWCGYIGSGVGDYAQQDFSTPEGIDVICELHGDSYTFMEDGNVLYSPEAIPVDSEGNPLIPFIYYPDAD